eukprot:scaffold78386_cov63-Phaeocystis_antarctica.AAC.7
MARRSASLAAVRAASSRSSRAIRIATGDPLLSDMKCLSGASGVAERHADVVAEAPRIAHAHASDDSESLLALAAWPARLQHHAAALGERASRWHRHRHRPKAGGLTSLGCCGDRYLRAGNTRVGSARAGTARVVAARAVAAHVLVRGGGEAHVLIRVGTARA